MGRSHERPFNGPQETFSQWIQRKGVLTRLDEAEKRVGPHQSKQVMPMELYVPRPGEIPAFLYSTKPPTLAQIIANDPNYHPYQDRKALVRYKDPHHEGQILETTESEALQQTVERLTAFILFAKTVPGMGYHLDGLTELVANLYLIGGPERRKATTGLAERMLAHAANHEVQLLLPDKRSDLYTATQLLHTAGMMNEQLGGALNTYIANISVIDSVESAVTWYAQSPSDRRLLIPDDQVMSGMQSRTMHHRIFKIAAQAGISEQQIRDATEMLLIAGRAPDQNHKDLYRAKGQDFNVYAYYRTLAISGINYEDAVTVLSIHCPGDFGFTDAQGALFRDVEQWYGITGALPAIFHQDWTIKPYDTDENGRFMYPDFQNQWEYAKNLLGDRILVEPESNSH